MWIPDLERPQVEHTLHRQSETSLRHKQVVLYVYLNIEVPSVDVGS